LREIPDPKEFLSLFAGLREFVKLVYRPRIVLKKIAGFFSLPFDGGGLGRGGNCCTLLQLIPLPPGERKL
jgi:hypothetical protein